MSNRGVAQLVEHWSPKPGVASSSLATPAINAEKRRHAKKWRFLLDFFRVYANIVLCHVQMARFLDSGVHPFSPAEKKAKHGEL